MPIYFKWNQKICFLSLKIEDFLCSTPIEISSGGKSTIDTLITTKTLLTFIQIELKFILRVI